MAIEWRKEHWNSFIMSGVMQMRSTGGWLFALNLHKLTSSQSRTRDTSFLLHHVTIDPTPRDDVHLLVAVDVINVKADVSVFREEFPSEWMKNSFQVAKQIQRPFINSVSTCGAMATLSSIVIELKRKKRCPTGAPLIEWKGFLKSSHQSSEIRLDGYVLHQRHRQQRHFRLQMDPDV